MKSLQEYRISYTGLKTGKHQFDFDIDERFFNEFEYSLVKTGALQASLELDKQETMIILLFTIKGVISLDCDVCLSGFPVTVDIHERVIAKFSEDEHLEDNTEEIIVLGKNEHEIDVSPLMYEYINLAVPYIHRCDEPGKTEWCDKEMLNKLEELSGNTSEEVNENETDADPRWEALKKIKNKN